VNLSNKGVPKEPCTAKHLKSYESNFPLIAKLQKKVLVEISLKIERRGNS